MRDTSAVEAAMDLVIEDAEAGSRLGMDLTEDISGGGSDGNTTSLFTATLDGLGPRGDGAHARHEHVEIESLVERAALIAELLMSPVESGY